MTRNIFCQFLKKTALGHLKAAALWDVGALQCTNSNFISLLHYPKLKSVEK
jgi:hypothetical protein